MGQRFLVIEETYTKPMKKMYFLKSFDKFIDWKTKRRGYTYKFEDGTESKGNNYYECRSCNKPLKEGQRYIGQGYNKLCKKCAIKYLTKSIKEFKIAIMKMEKTIKEA